MWMMTMAKNYYYVVLDYPIYNDDVDKMNAEIFD